MRRAVASPPALPGFTYEKLLGSGGFADVFLYRQQLPRRDVAVKVLLVDEIDSEARSRFVGEANVMAQLSTHPYIVTIYHADIADDRRPYFVMEYCPGPSLADRYKSRPLDVADALRTGIRVGSAVAAAHAQGILHRDIKPANVLTNSFGWPALTDFGIASTLEGDVPLHTTSMSSSRPGDSTASVGLSVPWSPPEMFLDDASPDVRSDVFSLAATIHTVLAGRTPFELPGRNNGTLDIIGRIERGAITPISRADVPRSLTAVLTKAMAPRRADRYDDAVQFVRALQRVELELGYAPTGIDLPGFGHRDVDWPAAGGPDETRVRPVAVIEAQPKTDATPIPETVLRPRQIAEPEPAAPAEAPVETPEPNGSPRRPRLLLGVTGGVLALVAAAVIVGVVVHGGGTTAPAATQQHAASAPPGNQLPTQVVPDAKAGKPATSAGNSVTFYWTNPTPKPGDQYLWYRDATNIDPQVTSATHATVTGVDPHQQVCIKVVIKRNGATSPDPLEECN